MKQNQKYSIILADPPWRYRDKRGKSSAWGSAESQYNTMAMEELKALPVASIASENSALFLWGTWPLLPQALELFPAWGFRYKTVAFLWIKTNRKKMQKFFGNLFPMSFEDLFFKGLGHYTQPNTEFCLVGTRGRLPRVSKKIRQVIFSPLRKHSQKPPETRERIVELYGNVPRIELFARDKVPGWESWGNQIESTISIIETVQERKQNGINCKK